MDNQSPEAKGSALTERWDLAEYAMSFVAGRQSDTQLATRCYGFSSANQFFLLGEGQVAELVSHPVYTPMPNAPDHLLGLANVRGNIVPYYQLNPFFPQSGELNAESHIYALLIGDVTNGVLVHIETKPVGIAKESLVEITDVKSTLGMLPKEMIKGAFVGQDKQWLMIDSQKLIHFLSSFNPI